MKEEYADKKTKEVAKGDRYSCQICNKVFRGPDFVKKHIANKHEDILDQKFMPFFEDKLKENYLADPQKFTNQPSVGQAFAGNPFRGRGGRRHQNTDWDQEGKEERKQREYVDYDDPGTQPASK